MVGAAQYTDEQIQWVLDQIVSKKKNPVIQDQYSKLFFPATLNDNQVRYIKNKYGKDPRFNSPMINLNVKGRTTTPVTGGEGPARYSSNASSAQSGGNVRGDIGQQRLYGDNGGGQAQLAGTKRKQSEDNLNSWSLPEQPSAKSLVLAQPQPLSTAPAVQYPPVAAAQGWVSQPSGNGFGLMDDNSSGGFPMPIHQVAKQSNFDQGYTNYGRVCQPVDQGAVSGSALTGSYIHQPPQQQQQKASLNHLKYLLQPSPFASNVLGAQNSLTLSHGNDLAGAPSGGFLGYEDSFCATTRINEAYHINGLVNQAPEPVNDVDAISASELTAEIMARRHCERSQASPVAVSADRAATPPATDKAPMSEEDSLDGLLLAFPFETEADEINDWEEMQQPELPPLRGSPSDPIDDDNDAVPGRPRDDLAEFDWGDFDAFKPQPLPGNASPIYPPSSSAIEEEGSPLPPHALLLTDESDQDEPQQAFLISSSQDFIDPRILLLAQAVAEENEADLDGVPCPLEDDLGPAYGYPDGIA